jgi:hypothetical protein
MVVAALLVLSFSGLGVVVLTVWTYFRLPLGEDTWGHYASGGSFVTAAPDLSADGTEIVFASPVSGQGDVYLCDVGGQKARRLPTSADCDISPCFRPQHAHVLFTREHDQRRHIWLDDLTTGADRPLTQGDVLDDIMDVSADGRYVLVGRSALTRGMGRHVSPLLLEIETGSLTHLPDNFFGRFRGSGQTLIGMRYQEASNSIIEVALDGTTVANHGTGFTFQGTDREGVRIVVGAESREFRIDFDLAVWNLKTGARESLGRGHSVCLFENGIVLFFSGYERQAWIWEVGGPPRKIDSPQTVMGVPRRSVGNRAAVFVTGQSRDYEPYLFDAETERFAPINFRSVESAPR